MKKPNAEIIVVVKDHGELQPMVDAAKARKPAMGQPCNHCGWCCINEVCGLGRHLTGSGQIPCRLLEQQGNEYYCRAARMDPKAAELIGAGRGCCAITVEEKLAQLTHKTGDRK